MPTYPIRRRPRECKTCLPCRASKVRCDRNVPCSNCVKRNFTCSYGRPQSNRLPISSSLTASSTPLHSSFVSPAFTPTYSSAPPPPSQPHDLTDVSSVTDRPSQASDDPDLPELIDISQGEWDDINNKMVAMEQIIGSLHSIFQSHSSRRRRAVDPPPETMERKRSSQSEGVYGSNSSRTGAVHLGSRSALVDILDKSKHSKDMAQALPQEDLLADLALENESAAYPFVDLWSSDPYTFNIAGVCAVLPDDEQCRRFLGFYREIGAVLYPVLPDLDDLEYKASCLLDNRRRVGGVYKPDANGLVKPFGMDLPFLSLLFAVLASGCQLSDITERERELTSWVYVSCAYQCLRMLNYVSQPTVEVIQILLIISNVLSYNMNAGASYTLLGMTERMCLVLGLHVESTGFSPEEQTIRRRVWWTMAFQNSHFSLAYDRPSITMVSQPEIPFDRKSMPGHRTYFETLCRVVSLSLEILRSRMNPETSQPRYHEIRDCKQRIQRMLAEATPHLRYKDQCHSLVEHIERTELRLHSSYLLSVMCRISLDPHAHMDEHRREIIREDCIASLIDTVDAFVELHEINSHCSRSWISLQRSIASAFLLVANDDSSQTWQLIDRLERVLADHVYADGDATHNSRTDSAKHLSSSLRALREIRDSFRSRKVSPSAPAPGQTFSPMVLRSPLSMDTTPEIPTSLASGTNSTLPVEDWGMRNILGRVSDVMLFPSMNGQSPAV
ncbi:uncharacterized protein N7469_003892 [Penicillium citrinum]|uniref:Zn(2)-C6 fungal-type domain-containing protein n=2 Tax=Penicillium TaxID=5073 RepID=A0A9W9P3F8_PENCI|nr:uncharacterized protein N7469_003892 [Penicillium citrinum]KAJ5234724.1 hypothetical protein N7469_003892 [Penicillium citrinum]KAJ5590343.1 hypothetical protein N7450_004315 [Penicillium hetheringtonii]